MVILGGTTHTCRVDKGQKPDIIFLGVNTHQTSDTEMRDCEVSPLESALWCQAFAQHQIRNGGVQAADWEVQQEGSAQHERTPRSEHATH